MYLEMMYTDYPGHEEAPPLRFSFLDHKVDAFALPCCNIVEHKFLLWQNPYGHLVRIPTLPSRDFPLNTVPKDG